MVTRVIKKEVSFCDECGKEESVQACLGCGVEHCWVCRSKMGYVYKHAVHFSGSGDGYFCHQCDNAPPENAKVIHLAYQRILALRDIEKNWHKNFDARIKVTEGELERLLDKREEDD